MFFAAFFGALYWARAHALPMLGNLDHQILWPDFKAVWPSAGGGVTASPAGTVEPFSTIGPWPLPTVNTAPLLTSGGELEITDVNRHYASAGRLDASDVVGWGEDAGKHWQHLADIGRKIEETGANKRDAS